MTQRKQDINFHVRDDMIDNFTPNVFTQPRVDTPQGDWVPARWLPVLYKRYSTEDGEDAYVIGKGKVVAFDCEGKLVPAGLRAALAKAAATVVLTYTADDAKWGVTDLVTGQKYVGPGTTAYTANEVALALLERGLVDGAAVVTGFVSIDFDDPPVTLSTNQIAEVVEAFISTAIGVSAYEFHVYSGRVEDGDQHFTNYSKQHQVQFLTATQMEVPHRVGSVEDDDDSLDGNESLVTAMPSPGAFPAPGEIWAASALADLDRYDIAASADVVAVKLEHRNIAEPTDRTPLTADVAGVLGRQRQSVATISREGDFFLDAAVGLLFIHVDTWATLVGGPTVVTLTYSHYDDAGAGVASERFVFLDGTVKPGDRLSYDEHSNLVRMGSAMDVLGAANTTSLGRFIGSKVFPRQLLQHVKTAFELQNMSNSGRMPGSATKGFSDQIFLMDEPVSDRLAKINFHCFE